MSKIIILESAIKIIKKLSEQPEHTINYYDLLKDGYDLSAFYLLYSANWIRVNRANKKRGKSIRLVGDKK